MDESLCDALDVIALLLAVLFLIVLGFVGVALVEERDGPVDGSGSGGDEPPASRGGDRPSRDAP